MTQLKQTGKELVLEGKAQSNARVSAFMREVENSAWLTAPKLSIIKGQDKSGQNTNQDSSGQLSDFTMFASQGTPGEAKAEGDKP